MKIDAIFANTDPRFNICFYNISDRNLFFWARIVRWNLSPNTAEYLAPQTNIGKSIVIIGVISLHCVGMCELGERVISYLSYCEEGKLS